MRLLPFILACALLSPLAPATPIIEDDAGSGRDAPDTVAQALSDPLVVATGAVHQGYTDWLLDRADVYSFVAGAGQTMYFDFAGPVGCIKVYRPDGTPQPHDASCTTGYASLGLLIIDADVTGLWMVLYSYLEPQVYRFSIGLEAPGPAASVVDPNTIFGSATPAPGVSPASQAGPHVVVAVVDTGINPYHDFFDAAALVDHPSTWLAGFPASAPTVALSLSAPSYEDAVAADGATWDSLARSTIYTFPGTRVVAGISFSEYNDPLAGAGVRPILDENGHGTHSAGLAAGANLPAAEGNVLIVIVEVGSGDFAKGVAWAASQTWIDAITLSAGTVANLPANSEIPLASRAAHEAGKPIFIASGNGFSSTGLAPDHCTTYTSGYTGPWWVTRIGAAEDSNSNPTYWHCLPVDVIARTNVGSPDSQSLTATSVASGTSAATPNAMGAYSRLLLAAKRDAIGEDRLDVLQHLLNASRPAATGIGAHDPSLAATAPFDQGYGVADGDALARALVTLPTGVPTSRPELDAWWARDRAIRVALWGEGQMLGGLGQNDAGSGGDAPNGIADDVRIQPGTAYHGLLLGIPIDDADVYAFGANAGQRIRVVTSGALHCARLYAPNATEMAVSCATGVVLGGNIDRVATTSGTWYLEISYLQPEAYGFAFAFGSAPPRPLPV